MVARGKTTGSASFLCRRVSESLGASMAPGATQSERDTRGGVAVVEGSPTSFFSSSGSAANYFVESKRSVPRHREPMSALFAAAIILRGFFQEVTFARELGTRESRRRMCAGENIFCNFVFIRYYFYQ